jgi:hypothetical protein
LSPQQQYLIAAMLQMLQKAAAIPDSSNYIPFNVNVFSATIPYISNDNNNSSSILKNSGSLVER